MVDAAEGGLSTSLVDVDLVECLLIVVDELASLDHLAPELAGLVESRVIRILDLVCVSRRSSDGVLEVLEIEDVESLAGLYRVDGEVGGLLSQRDVEAASLSLGAGSSAIVLLVEDRWAGGLSEAAKRAGGRVVAGERISRARIEAVHDA